MEKVNVDEMGTGIQNEVPETVNVTEKADKSHNLTVGESLLLIVIMGVIGFGLWAGGSYIVEEIYPEFIRPLVCDDVSYTMRIGPDMEFRSYTYREGGYIARKGGEDKLLDRVDWVVDGQDTDSLAVVSHKGKIGYYNRYTGEMVIPATFDYGWVFSEGLAAVAKDNRLKFIDRTGKVVIDRHLESRDQETFIFKDGLCKVYDANNGKAGLIGTDGQWKLPARCESFESYGSGWIFSQDGFYGIYHNEKGVVLPPEYAYIHIVEGNAMVQSSDNVISRYDLDGNKVSDIVIYEVGNLPYPTDKVASANNRADIQYVMEVADCQYYKVNSEIGGLYWGLMDKNGNCITKPIYTHIEAISHNRYLTYPHGQILDNAGKEVDCYDL